MTLSFKEWLLSELGEIPNQSGKLRRIGSNMFSGEYGPFNVLLTVDERGVNVNFLTSDPKRPAGSNFSQYLPDFVNDLCGLGVDVNDISYKAMDQGGEMRTAARERMFAGMMAKAKQMAGSLPNCGQKKQPQVPAWWKGPPEEYHALMGSGAAGS